ncbi:LAFE_0A04038g1_1 [Lachancea fermentati]|uniref:LAFE_0A04038g1_1 n=1 Tax=Lachancea fermentati TaxID=4955 RepID=A0A1G4M716_LACFM|nr:LAFE_0A04038g1_1 [Lachancea fermentati]
MSVSKENSKARHIKNYRKREMLRKKIKQRGNLLFGPKNQRSTEIKEENTETNQLVTKKPSDSAEEIARLLLQTQIQEILTENFILLGSTGMTGKNILSQLSQPWIYLGASGNLQSKLNELDAFLEEKNDLHNSSKAEFTDELLQNEDRIKIRKNIFCFNRKPISFDSMVKLENLNDDWKHELNFNEKCFTCTKADLQSVSSPAAEGEFVLPKGPDRELEFRIYLQLQEFTYLMDYLNEDQKVQIELQVAVTIFLENNSEKWPSIMTRIFKKSQSDGHIFSKESNAAISWNIPPLKRVSTLISALGSTYFQQQKSHVPRGFVDYDLNMQMASKFVSDKVDSCFKRMVVVTSFNNLILSNVNEYFNTKLRLEHDLISQIHSLDQLVVLRPGPLVGSHTDDFMIKKPTKSSFLLTKPINKALYYQKYFLEFNSHLSKEIAQVGLRTKIAEKIAAFIYQRSFSCLFGYAVPVEKVANVAAVRAISPSCTEHPVVIIKSDEIDKL